MGIGVRRILEPAARVADFGVEDAGHVTENFLDTPETAAGEHGHLRLFLTRNRRAARSVLITDDGSSSRGDSFDQCDKRLSFFHDICGEFRPVVAADVRRRMRRPGWNEQGIAGFYSFR